MFRTVHDLQERRLQFSNAVFGGDSAAHLCDLAGPSYKHLPDSVGIFSAFGQQIYVQMVIAWYMATALAKQWAATFPYIKGRKLSPWIHNKTIQKACESYRITDAQKKILRGLKLELHQ